MSLYSEIESQVAKLREEAARIDSSAALSGSYDDYSKGRATAYEISADALERILKEHAEPKPTLGLHPNTQKLVDDFANALAEKLRAAEVKYGYEDGWSGNDWMDTCRAKLREHLEKGDPRDVAAYCAFLWYHGESTASEHAGEGQVTDEMVAAGFKACEYRRFDKYHVTDVLTFQFIRQIIEAALTSAVPVPQVTQAMIDAAQVHLHYVSRREIGDALRAALAVPQSEEPKAVAQDEKCGFPGCGEPRETSDQRHTGCGGGFQDGHDDHLWCHPFVPAQPQSDVSRAVTPEQK